ncbi:DAK2 domain-containing protein [Salisediminibacterium halotolerans]|uniref:DAK2 domain-containing protein n=1 Tax=Salisediminibacterium halotolerans TaxID=517425 RepID=UPI000EB453E8|nr:DAK2 domain-containing protein [Salisediminibacterium halotolerans]RLJ74266.1 hypothetical protein BCL39_1554 [Actinophytocola xinjiangensis]RPE87642.1 hypothetical protein EDD67_1378 [Salisediminibacterium halotolerans]TWG35103.1 hypothetical protein BCL52_1551 [Salisediminibacterium halotolerans]GEL06849.1 kinase [Salisediminibacterium halotolerans]
MAINEIDGKLFSDMLVSGANNLSNQAQKIDALNVFPVPDGDTGTNMNLTITSGVKEVNQSNDPEVGKITSAFAKGLLMGARGNSGVILSQLFRGFSKSVEGKTVLTAKDLSAAFENGVDMAYKAVMKPVEGTILTVAKDAAAAAVSYSKKDDDVIGLMKAVKTEAEASLERTPDLLPVLKEVGVVDSGGQGLLSIYEGFLCVLEGDHISADGKENTPSMEELVKFEHHSAQSHMATEDIQFSYCTEVMVKFDEDSLQQNPYNEDDFRELLSQYGDSLLVVSDDDLLKIHIHADFPGEVINEAQKFGSLVNIKAEDMREQHSTILQEDSQASQSRASQQQDPETADFAVITVSMGPGIADLFKGLGVTKVIEGGQTMNPSTEDFLKAIDDCQASRVILLPNNSNIVMAAQQAADVADIEASVVPSKSVPQGLASMLGFDREGGLEANVEDMKESMQDVKTGEVTYAVRDTEMSGVSIKKGDYMGIQEKTILSNGPSVQDVAQQLIDGMIDESSEIVTIIYGEERSSSEAAELADYIEANYVEVEAEVHNGGQPLYSYLISVE